MKDRKAFQFYRSYFDVLNEIYEPEDKLNFLMAILEKQFTDKEPQLEGISKLAYASVRYQIDRQVEGFKSKNLITKDPTEGTTEGPSGGPTQGPSGGPTQGPSGGPSEANQQLNKKDTLHPTEGPTQGPTQGPTEGPYQQEKEKEKEKEKEQAQLQEKNAMQKKEKTMINVFEDLDLYSPIAQEAAEEVLKLKNWD